MAPANVPLSTTLAQAPFLAVPRDRGDEACEVLSPIAFKVWYRIVRLTHGWSREEAYISYSDFMRACGIDRKSVTKALKELIAKGFARLVEGLGIRGAHAYALLNSTRGNIPPVNSSIPSNVTRLGEKIPQSIGKKSPGTRGKNPLDAARQPAPEQAPREAIETLIETSIEKETYYAAEVQGELDVAPSARSSEEEQWLRQERNRLEDELAALQAIDERSLPHKEQIDLRIKRRIAQRNLDELSDSPAQDNAPTPPAPEEQASVIQELPAAPLYESEITIETRTPEPAALFPEAIPPAPAERPFAVVARLFFREDVKITQDDAKEIQSVVNVLHEHGVDDPLRIEELHMFWRDHYRELKRKTMYHFKRYAFQVAQ